MNVRGTHPKMQPKSRARSPSPEDSRSGNAERLQKDIKALREREEELIADCDQRIKDMKTRHREEMDELTQTHRCGS